MLNDRTGKAYPCKTYATEAAAEKATAEIAMACGKYFALHGSEAESANYVVFYVAEWGRWVGAVNQSEVLHRPNASGGYLGVVASKGFYIW